MLNVLSAGGVGQALIRERPGVSQGLAMTSRIARSRSGLAGHQHRLAVRSLEVRDRHG
jgi:hypothetical protein